LQEESSLIFGWRLLIFELRFKMLKYKKSVRWKRTGFYTTIWNQIGDQS
jgi:hypothetical protein